MRTGAFLAVGIVSFSACFAQESCDPFLFEPCTGDPQFYECVQVTTNLTSTKGGESAQVLQELCFFQAEGIGGSPLFGGPDRPDLGILLETDRGVLKIEELDVDDEIGQLRFDPEELAGVPAKLTSPITVTATAEDSVSVESRITEANQVLIDEVLTYDPTDAEHNGGLLLQGTFTARPTGGFSLFLHLAELDMDAVYPGLEYSDLQGVGSPVPLFFEPINKDDLYILSPQGGPLVVTTTLSAVNELGTDTQVEIEEIIDITPSVSGPRFRRGDANRDGAANIADAIFILQNLFASGPPILCPDAADANDDEGVNIADGIYILQNLFASGPPIVEPHPDCGVDTTGNPAGGDDLPACDYCAEACQEPPVPCE